MDETVIAPCVRGCVHPQVDEDVPAKPKPANHGDLCDSCYYRIVHALKLVPDLMANMRAQINGFGAVPLTERVSGGGGGSPAPLQIGPLDASDSLYAKLIQWTRIFSEEFNVTPPAVPSWSNSKEVQGSKPVSVEAAHLLAGYLVEWFNDRADQIAMSPSVGAWHDDLCTGWEDARGVFSLAKSYGIEARPPKPADKRKCPVCDAHEIFVSYPNALDSDLNVLCGRCAYVVPAESYAPYLRVMAS